MSIEQLEEKLQEAPFVECGLTQERSVGWTPPRGEANGVLAESIGGQWLLKLMMESKEIRMKPSSSCCPWPSRARARSRSGLILRPAC